MVVTGIRAAVAARAYPGETVSGDAWRVDQDGQRYRISVIDGLGHGPEAAIAAEAAIAILAGNPHLDPGAALAQCHHALQRTRGAAMCVVSIDLDAHQLVYAGVGNVEARFLSAGVEKRLSSARGILGSALPRIVPDALALEDGWRLVIHTDGVRARFRLADVLAEHATAQDVADAILAGWGRETDDATVIVAGDEDGSL